VLYTATGTPIGPNIILRGEARRPGCGCRAPAWAARHGRWQLTQLSNTEAGTIYVFDDTNQEFRLRATYGMDDKIIAEIKDHRIRIGETAIDQAAAQRVPVQIPDAQADPSSLVLDVIVRAGFRALLVVPLVGADRIAAQGPRVPSVIR
jgi:GAF domain-containing protein